MGKYPLDPQFESLQTVEPKLKRATALPLQTVFSLMPFPSDKRTKVTTKRIPGPDGNRIRLRVIRPRKRKKDAPCLFYMHGGGFYFPSAPYHFTLMKEYAVRTGCVIVYPDYRLAPKHPYPAAVDDCWTAYDWMLKHAAKLGINTKRIAVGGDSAGGNLAAVMALMARDRGVQQPMFQLLIYPVTDRRMETSSARRYRDTPVWNTALSEKMWAYYLPTLPTEHIEYASPMEAESFAGLPDAYVEVSEFDSLRDDGLNYAAALEAAGARVKRYETIGTPHGFEFVLDAPIAQDAVDHRVDALKEAFER